MRALVLLAALVHGCMAFDVGGPIEEPPPPRCQVIGSLGGQSLTEGRSFGCVFGPASMKMFHLRVQGSPNALIVVAAPLPPSSTAMDLSRLSVSVEIPERRCRARDGGSGVLIVTYEGPTPGARVSAWVAGELYCDDVGWTTIGALIEGAWL